MKLKKLLLGLLAATVLAGTAGWFSLDKETRGLLATLPTNRDLLFWSEPQRDAAFRAMDRLPVLAKWRDRAGRRHAAAAAAGPAAEARAGRGCLHGRPAQRGAAGRARRQAAAGALRAGLRRQPGAGPASRSPSRSPPRWSVRRCATATSAAWTTRSATTSSDEGLGLRRRQHPPAADHDLGRALERGLCRPQRRRGALQQPPARGRRRCAGQLPAPAAARGARRHALALQHRRDQPGRHPRQPGDQAAAGRATCRRRSGARPAWSSRRPGS